MDMMNRYVREYGSYNAMDMREYLQSWYEAKSQYLLPIFHNRLIIKKPINYAKNDSHIEWDLEEHFFTTVEWERLCSSLCKMLRYTLFNGDLSHHWEIPKYEKESLFFDFVSASLLNEVSWYRKNYIKREGDISVYPNKHNSLIKPLIITNGSRPFRAIKTLIKNIVPVCQTSWPHIFSESFFTTLYDDLEKTRIAHSQILNVAGINGTLCLSIHPMDYITMSDTGYDWDSCMTWTREEGVGPGEYRAGTLEMLNSPSVIVAYIEGNEPYYPVEEYRWSNKKWRELFVISKEFITGIRGYPYKVDELDNIILEELARLAEARGYSRYQHTMESTIDHKMMRNDISTIYLDTTLMYNDYSFGNHHYFRTSNPGLGTLSVGFKYSGQAYCLDCGAPLPPNQEEAELLTCPECRGFYKCSDCGAYVPINEVEHVLGTGEILCDDCGAECDKCGDTEYADLLSTVYVPYKNGLVTYCACEQCLNQLSPYLIHDRSRYPDISISRFDTHVNILLPTVPDDDYYDLTGDYPPKEELLEPIQE